MKVELSPRERKIAKVGIGGTLALAVMTALPSFNAPRTAQAEGEASPSPVSLDATPVPGTNPEVPYTILNNEDFKIPMGTSKDVPANTVIVGDAIGINGQAWTDSDALSGLVTIMKEPGTVTAGSTWSLDQMQFATLEEAQKFALAKVNDFSINGCGLPDGCERTDVLYFPGEMQGVQENQYDSIVASTGGSEPTPMPSASPDASATPMPEDQTAILQAILKELEEIQACVCTGDCPHKSPEPSMSPTPTPSESPEACPTDSEDIEYAYTGWNKNGILDREKAPKETKTVTRAIFQSDGAWRFDGQGNWKESYDNESDTALIYVYEFDTPRTVQFSYDWGGDLQIIPECPTADEIQDTILQRDIEQTLARPEINSVKVVYVNADGSTRSEVLR